MSNVHRVLRLDTCCVTRALIQEMPAMNDPIKDDSEYEVFSNGGGGVPAAGAGLVAAEEDDSNSSDAESDVSDQEGVPAGYQALPQEPSQQHTQGWSLKSYWSRNTYCMQFWKTLHIHNVIQVITT